jgi:hypothetical protein
MEKFQARQKEMVDRLLADFNEAIDEKGEPDWAAEPEQ